MWRKIKEWLFPRVTEYNIAPRVLSTMQAMALQTHPREAFAVLRGKHVGKKLMVKELAYQPFLNTERSAHAHIDRYTITDLAGTFHSHPVPDARPSAADRRLWSKHPGIHCILAYPYGEAHVYNHHGVLLSVHPISYPVARRAR